MFLISSAKVCIEVIAGRRNNGLHFSPKGKNGVQNAIGPSGVNFHDKNIFQKNCPFGCPCDAFDCQPDKKSVLVLNTYSSNKPVLMKFDGEYTMTRKIHDLLSCLRWR